MEPFAAWITRDVVHVSGPDAVSFLHGQLSQDIAGLAIGTSAWSLLLQPSGKTVAWLRATRTGETEVVLDGDAGSGDAIVARLERFKLRTKADFAPEWAIPCLAVRGRVGDGLPIAWPDLVGDDQLGPSGTVPDGVDVVDEATYELARIEAGVPAFGRELTEATIPVELGQWLIDASVSFTKGCYTGQELVARIDSRGGNAPRPIRRLVIDGRVAAGDAVDVDGKVVGPLTSAAWSEERAATVALAVVPRAIDGGASVGGHPARLIA
jgi:folate-binding protein YgfZ